MVVHPNQPQCWVLTTTNARVGVRPDHELVVTLHEAMDANLPARRKLNTNASAIAATSELGDEGNERRGRGTAAGELGYSMKGSTCGRAKIFRMLRVRTRAHQRNGGRVRRMKSALVRRVGNVALLVHPSGTMPDDEEWTLIMREVALLPKESRMVIWAGGSINEKQRRAASQGNNTLRPRAVLFTDSFISRGRMSTTWMGMDVTAYCKARFAPGMTIEGFAAAETEELRAAIANMERELTAEQPPGS